MAPTNTNSKLTYKDAGVNIDAGNTLVEHIKPIARKTQRPEVLAGLGGFAALFELPLERYQNPILVSATDGVGTKLKLAIALKQHDTIGIDLVAMCVNDIITQGAEPLFFLDYYATGRLNVDSAKDVITGIGRGCELAGAALVGGETAEMPGMYHGDDYDLAGFCVGIVEKAQLIDGSKVTPGDVLIGIASSGLHANGFSLVRKILELKDIALNTPIDEQTLGETLLTPTRIYVKPLLALLKSLPVHAIAHITGGGLLENLPRVLPEYVCATINANQWEKPAIFDWLQTTGNLSDNEMMRTFNNGIGLVVCVSADVVDQSLTLLHEQGERAWVIGTMETREPNAPAIIIHE